MKKICLALILSILSLLLPKTSSAADLPTVTIVNPIRGPQLGLEKVDLLASLRAQWNATKEASVPATWLWQYSALENPSLVSLAKTEMQNQEHGVFLEIDKNTAEKSEISYKGKNQWYHSDGLLLVSYDQYERRNIIDTTFKKFREIFGYFPTSVGAWWVGADAINYMKQKYNITAVLQCSDQFETDAYSIWGTPWSIPYLSRYDNAAVPAQNFDSSSKAVIMQWAPRDPVRAYGSSVTNSTYSLQDYATKGYDLRYREYLANIFASRGGDQIVFGLEGGIIPEGYKDFRLQVQQAKIWQNQNQRTIKTMRQYADEFITTKKVLPPTASFLTKDYESQDQSFWYNSPSYRVGIIKKGEEISLIDLRDYTNTPEEDFNLVPNSEKLLRINTFAIIDSVRFPEQRKVLARSAQPLRIEKNNQGSKLFAGDQELVSASEDRVYVNGKEITFIQNNEDQKLINSAKWLLKREKFTDEFKRWQSTAFQSKKQMLKTLGFVYLIVGFLLTCITLVKQKNYYFFLIAIILALTVPINFVFKTLNQRENIQLLPFESRALLAVQQANKRIVYLQPAQDKEYRAIQPFIYSKPYLAEKLTKRKWTYKERYKERYKEKPLTDLPSNIVIVVPRYTGQEIYDEEISRMNLHKIFDNAQIALFTRD